jgi:hypothetical protein
MFVRWKRRKRRGRWTGKGRPRRGAGVTYTAVLVESARVDGRPRQLFVARLGSIQDCELGRPLWRQRFWEGVRTKLDKLGVELDPKSIDSAIEAVVPHVTPEEEAEIERDRQEAIRLNAEFRAAFALRRRR